MLLQYFVSEERMEQVLDEFCKATPRIQKDARFNCGVAISDDGQCVPFVYETEELVEDGMPSRYVYIKEVSSGTYHVKMSGMFITWNSCPAKWFPRPTSVEDLDEDILYAWRNWYSIRDAYRNQAHFLQVGLV